MHTNPLHNNPFLLNLTATRKPHPCSAGIAQVPDSSQKLHIGIVLTECCCKACSLACICPYGGIDLLQGGTSTITNCSTGQLLQVVLSSSAAPQVFLFLSLGITAGISFDPGHQGRPSLFLRQWSSFLPAAHTRARPRLLWRVLLQHARGAAAAAPRERVARRAQRMRRPALRGAKRPADAALDTGGVGRTYETAQACINDVLGPQCAAC